MKLNITKCLILVFLTHLADSDQQVQDSEEDQEYQYKFTFMVPNRGESCYFLENMRVGYVINLHYMVLSSKNGKQLDISMRVRDPSKRLVTFQARKTEGHYTDYKVAHEGDYEVCFNNKYSMYEEKKIMCEADIQGDENANINEIIKKVVNRTLEVWDERTTSMHNVINKVRTMVMRARHQQNWTKNKGKQDQDRIESLQTMIDRWSLGYSFLVFSVMIAQIIALRSFFKIKPSSSNLNFRT